MIRGKRSRGKSVTTVNCNLTWNNVFSLTSISGETYLKTTWMNSFCFAWTWSSLKTPPPSTFMSAPHLRPLFTSPSGLDVLRNPAFGHVVFSETDGRKWFIHQTRLRTQIPADLLISWLILQVLGAGAALIRSVGGARCTGHHLSRRDSQPEPHLASANEHVASPNQIRNRGDDGVIRGPERTVRAVIIYLLEEIWIWPQVCELPLFLRASHQNFVEAERYIYTHSSKLSDCFGLAISKCSAEEDEWVQLSVVLKLTSRKLAHVRQRVPINRADADSPCALNHMK